MIIPEKCETYDILFLLTHAESFAKIYNLVNQLCEFERYLDQNKSVEKIMPDLVQKYKKYSGYKLKQLCQEIHLKFNVIYH